MLNSFGHPVPRVAGTLQVTGRSAQAKFLKTEFTDAADTYVMDISSAYKVAGLKKLERTFIFSREGKGKLTVTDVVEFDRPQAFGTALITFAKWKQPEQRSIDYRRRQRGRRGGSFFNRRQLPNRIRRYQGRSARQTNSHPLGHRFYKAGAEGEYNGCNYAEIKSG